MRKFGDFIDDDEEGDRGGEQHAAPEPEISINVGEGQESAAETPLAPSVAIEKNSTLSGDRALTPRMSVPAPAPAPVQVPQHNFKPGHRPAPPAAKRRPRYSGHNVFNNLVREDWQRAIEDDPYAFDGLIYLPSVAERPAVDKLDYEAAEFTEINNNQRELVYGLPHPVVILDCPDERENFFAVDNDTDQDGNVDEFQVLRVAATGIPIGSVFEWNEELADGTTVPRWWYVMKIFNYGTAAVGSLYFCVPARNFEGADHKGTPYA